MAVGIYSKIGNGCNLMLLYRQKTQKNTKNNIIDKKGKKQKERESGTQTTVQAPLRNYSALCLQFANKIVFISIYHLIV